jgi:hypothetical protein
LKNLKHLSIAYLSILRPNNVGWINLFLHILGAWISFARRFFELLPSALESIAETHVALGVEHIGRQRVLLDHLEQRGINAFATRRNLRTLLGKQLQGLVEVRRLAADLHRSSKLGEPAESLIALQ